MMIAGQIAVRIVPQWSINAGMQSQLDPATAPKQQAGLVQPVLPEILTPLGWFDTFLTPNSESGDGVVFPPFIVIETATPSPTASPTVSPTVTQTPTATVSPSPTVVTSVPSVTSTTRPPDDDNDKTPTPTAPTTCTDPLASNFNGPLPCTYPPPPVTSTIDPSLTEVPPPAEIEVGAPDGVVANVAPGTYIVLDISGNPVHEREARARRRSAGRQQPQRVCGAHRERAREMGPRRPDCGHPTSVGQPRPARLTAAVRVSTPSFS